jgi:hypothetical protein
MTPEAHTASKAGIYKSLQPVESIQRTVDEMQERYFEGHTVVGVHMRRADHLQYRRKDPRRTSPTKLFVEAIERVLKDSPHTRFFLATDDKEEEASLIMRFPKEVVVYEKEGVSRKTKKGIQDALIDWLLLSRTSAIIYSKTSSFSEEAAVVNAAKREPILKEDELSKTHYRILFREVVTPHYLLLKREGLRTYLSLSYRYRRRQVADWVRSRFSSPG